MSLISFNEQDLTVGTIITSQYAEVEFSTSSEFGLMLFDTNNVSGEDFDLSATDLGNVLIISEDGDTSDPDDNAAGGTISLEFAQPATVNSLGLLDMDLPGGSIVLYDESDRAIETVEIEDLGYNSFQELDLNFDNVARLDLNLAGSGALTGIDFDLEQTNSFSKIYAFGDSLVDTGNLFNATAAIANSSADLGLIAIPPSPLFFEGRFSNGQIWLDNLAEAFDIDLTPATELSTIAPGSDILSPVTIIDGTPRVSPFFNGSTTTQSVNFGYGLATTGANGTGELGSLVPGMEQQVDAFIADHQQALVTS
ncbi:MAG: SGNH/GDSL hydrolase family protein [Cyanobacteria bacterium J06600_6]